MKTEHEVKILDIDVEAVTEKLHSLGAQKKGEKTMRRYVYDIEPGNEQLWMRLRDAGEKTTLTIKEIVGDSIDGVRELEVELSDFESTNRILNRLGFKHKAFQENKRISFVLDGVKIEIDFWPKIPPYLEIEGESEEAVKEMVSRLGFEMSQTTTANTLAVYKKYGANVLDFKELRLDEDSKKA